MRSAGELTSSLPDAVVDLAVRWRAVAAGRLHRREPNIDDVAAELVLPLLVEPDWPGPAPPVPVSGGWVQADLIDDDRETFARLRAERPRAGPEALASLAQQLRLPVVPYRSEWWSGAVMAPPSSGAIGRVDLRGRRVVDLSALWAGPLATRLLADAGADVVKLDSSARPDGFGVRPSLYEALNGPKQIVDLDLRRADDRATFERLVVDAELLVTSMSRRVLPNLGYPLTELRRLNPTLGVLAIVGFPEECPERDWLAYGTGVHAVSGLGIVDGRPVPAPVAYPDALAGMAAFALAPDVLGSGQYLEIPLVSVAAAALPR